jgi:hypothetical protein
MIGNIFSNHWKKGEKFFQSLEKMHRFFQPLENIFPIIGNFFQPLENRRGAGQRGR